MKKTRKARFAITVSYGGSQNVISRHHNESAAERELQKIKYDRPDIPDANGAIIIDRRYDYDV